MFHITECVNRPALFPEQRPTTPTAAEHIEYELLIYGYRARVVKVGQCALVCTVRCFHQQHSERHRTH